MLAEKIYLEEEKYELKNLLLAYPSDWFLIKETLEKAKQSDAILLGAVGGSKWDTCSVFDASLLECLCILFCLLVGTFYMCWAI